ncbi:MAG TPA: protein kinase [Ktedonobacterales bacterium]|nr:protein kinase [Ktedonobacterales bacterium]
MRLSDLIGQNIGPYQVIEELGEGGTARVYRAFDTSHSRQVAVKALQVVSDDRATFLQRFRREVDAIRQLHHPNIVEVYDFGEEDEFVFLVLPFLDGGTLRQKIAGPRLSTQEVCQYMIQIALALHHAHEKGIIHRDVKPSNMMLHNERPGAILLTDFGTAKIQNAQGLTKTGATVGTPEYMSPEQAQGLDVDQRSDIYSLGCSMYEALAGRPPFLGANPVSVLYQQVHAQPTYIRSYNTETPRALWDILHRCLAKQPDARYGTARSLAEDLQPFAEGLIQPTPAHGSQFLTGAPVLNGNPDSSGRQRRPPSVTLPPAVTPGSWNTGAPVVQNVSDSLVVPLGQNISMEQAPEEGGPIQLHVGKRAQNSRPTFGPDGAKPGVTLRSTAGRSGLLSRSGPLTPEERAAAAAWEGLDFDPPLAPASQPLVGSGQQPPYSGAPPADIYPTIPTPIATPFIPQRGPTSGSARASNSNPYVGPNSGGLYPAPTSRARVTTRPVDVGGLRADIDLSTLGQRRSKRPSPVALGAALVGLIALSVALGFGGVKLFAKQSVSTQPTPRAAVTATIHPTATATTAQPTATTTPTAQQLLDQRAAAAFRAITIAPFSDSACSSASMTTHFSGPVYINLCMANSRAPGPITVVVRQNGAVVRTLISNLYPSAGSYYTQGHTLGAGSYDMLITMQINGKQAVARDIAFTVS